MIRRVRRSLMLKWTLFSIFLATIPLAIAGFRIIQIYQADLKKSVIEIEEMKANLIMEKTVAFFDKVTNDLFFITRDDHLSEVIPSLPIKRLLEESLYKNGCLIELTLLDEKGQEVVKVSKYRVFDPSDLKRGSKSEMFGKASMGQIYFGDFQLLSDVVPTTIVAVPIEKGREKVTGVLSARIHLQYLWNLLPHTQIGQKGSIYIVDKEGNLIAHPDSRKVLSGLNVKHLPMVNQVVSGKEGNLEFENPEERENYLGVYKPIKELNWGVIVQVPVREAYAPVIKVANTALKWILIALGVAVVLGYFLTRKLILPIKILSNRMDEVAKGNLGIYIDPTTRDEIGLLTESFNKMIQDLKQSQDSLKEAEEKYRTIFENSKDMVYIASLDGRLIDVNQAGVGLFGYESKDEMMRIRTGDAFLSREDRRRFQEEIGKEGYVKDFEVRLKRKDGTALDCLITATVRKDAEGHIRGYEGIIKDISLRKRMEEELLQRARELQALYDLSVLTNQSLNPDTLLPVALDKAMSLTGFEIGSLHLLREEDHTLELRSEQGLPSVIVEKAKDFKVSEGACGMAIALKRPVIFSIEEYPTPWIIPQLKEEGIQILVGVPLLAKERAIGAISLLSRSSRVLTEWEIHLLESIGNQIGLALENAQLFSNVVKAKSEWETTFDAVTDLITIRDKDYRILRANKAALERFGIEPREMIGKKCYETLHHRESPCGGCYVAKTLETQKPGSGERESLYLNGTFQYYTFPVFNDSREIIAVIDLARDITEERQIAKEQEVAHYINRILASSLDVRQVMKGIHSELKKVLGSEMMTITLLDERGKDFRYFALEKNYEARELTEEMVYPREGTALGKAVDTGAPVFVRDTSKKDFWINQKLMKEGIRSLLIFPLKYEGKVFGTLNFGSKETNHFLERHTHFLSQVTTGLAISIKNSLLLDEIKESEEKYRTVVEAAHDGVCVTGENYQFTYVNGRMAELLGYSRDELIGMDFREVLDEESKGLVVNRYVRRQRGEEVPSRYEFDIVRKSGEIRNVEISSTVIKDSKGYTSTISFYKDISEKIMMEEQLVQAEKLRALGEMASGIAHDFNNALAVILGNTQLLLYTAKDEDSRETLQTIEKVARDGAQTIRRLQDFTRKRVPQLLFKLDINSIVQDAMEITRPKWKDDVQGRGISIEMVSRLGDLPPVAGNASELREVITNMIFNAVEAMPKGGKIELLTFQKDENVCIQVRDTGMGMTEEVRRKIFEPFFTTKPFTNTGLGLSMSYGIIQRFGGKIEVESKAGSGTIFMILLPIGTGEKEVPAVSYGMQKGHSARILVVDDEEAVRDVLSKILSQVSHQVTVARDGEEGIRLFKEGMFDLVLTDLGMPGLSGWEVCRMIKKINPQTPVGMITGWGMELSQKTMKEYGLDFMISKPFEFNQIVKIVAETMEPAKKRFWS